jgi:hypothetical protein
MLPLTRNRSRSRFFSTGASAPSNDPNWANVALLLNTTSTNGAQNNTFLDSSTNAFTVTRNGDTTQGSFTPFAVPSGQSYSAATYGGSGYFDGTGDYLSIPSDAAFDFGAGDFTIEGWINTTATDSGGVVARRGTSNTAMWEIFKSNSILQFYGDNNSLVCSSTRTINDGAWHHFAVVRNGNNTTMYVDGVAGTTDTTLYTYPTGDGTVWIANDQESPTARDIQAYLSNIRIVKGTAVYTAAFTPPTSPLTAIANTSLLLNFTNAGIYDAATINDGQTVGNAQVSTTQAKWSPTSMSFDGTGDWLTIIDKPALRFGTAAFTIEFWLYLGATGAARGLVAKGTSTTGWLVSTDASNKVVFTYDTSTITSSGALSGSQWYFITVVREGTGSNQTKIYIDGVNDGTGTVNTNFNQTSIAYVGANRTGGDALNGYIDELRITNGVARYTGNFTPPTAAFPTL